MQYDANLAQMNGSYSLSHERIGIPPISLSCVVNQITCRWRQRSCTHNESNENAHNVQYNLVLQCTHDQRELIFQEKSNTNLWHRKYKWGHYCMFNRKQPTIIRTFIFQFPMHINFLLKLRISLKIHAHCKQYIVAAPCGRLILSMCDSKLVIFIAFIHFAACRLDAFHFTPCNYAK